MRKFFVLCLVCSALFLAFFVARPASSQPVKPQALENAPPVPSDDRELRARVMEERYRALVDELRVQELMKHGVDPDRADKVRLILLETRVHERDKGRRYEAMQVIREAEKQKLRAVLTAKELDLLKESWGHANDAKYEAGRILQGWHSEACALRNLVPYILELNFDEREKKKDVILLPRLKAGEQVPCGYRKVDNESEALDEIHVSRGDRGTTLSLQPYMFDAGLVLHSKQNDSWLMEGEITALSIAGSKPIGKFRIRAK